MSRVAMVVQMDVKPEHRDAFIEVMRGHAENCLRLEDGCLYFDVAISREDPNRIVLYEVYRDQAARESHAASAHLAKTRENYSAMLNGRSSVEIDVF